MASRADFTEEGWDLVLEGPTEAAVSANQSRPRPVLAESPSASGSFGFRRLARRQAVALSLASLLLLLVTATALAVTGDLTQPTGSAGCVSETGSGPCADGHRLSGPRSVAVSADGKSVYVASYEGNAVARLNRNTTTGAISQPVGTTGCISQTGAGPCADGHGLSGASDVAVSPDGKSVYVSSDISDAVARFTRNTTTGAISQPAAAAGCISESGAGPCTDGHGLNGASDVVVSPDGKSVYVVSYLSNAVARLNRNTTTGAISQPAGTAGCVSQTGAGPCADGHALNNTTDVALSADGKGVYVSSDTSDAVARFARNTTTGAINQPAGAAGCISQTGAGPCADGHGLGGAYDVAVSPDGKSVYVASNESFAVARLNRNTTTGAISQPAGAAGCVSETGAGPCANGHGLPNPYGVVVSPDGKSVYAASPFSGAVALLTRNTATGALAQPAGTTGCVSETGSGPCADGHALDGAEAVAVSPDGKSVYVASFLSDAVARFDRAP
ncbi:MAG: beta-propeller fold lactonase family protein [Actinomycetota bacterium]